MTTFCCSLCKEVKETTEFAKKAGSVRGHASACRLCMAAKDKAYRASETGKASALRRFNAAKESKKQPVRQAVRLAIRDGELTKWPICAMPDCSNTQVEAHHADYSRPLDVVWLCVRHHRDLHEQVNPRPIDRVCTVCRERKALTEFSPSTWTCRACRPAKDAQRRGGSKPLNARSAVPHTGENHV